MRFATTTSRSRSRPKKKSPSSSESSKAARPLNGESRAATVVLKPEPPSLAHRRSARGRRRTRREADRATRRRARIRVRNLERLPRATRIAVTEPTAIPPRRDVRDDVELLSRVEQCLLEREVVARRDDERMR